VHDGIGTEAGATTQRKGLQDTRFAGADGTGHSDQQRLTGHRAGLGLVGLVGGLLGDDLLGDLFGDDLLSDLFGDDLLSAAFLKFALEILKYV
jgi:hypothetical protein